MNENQNNKTNTETKEQKGYKLNYLEFERFAPTKAEKIITTQRLAKMLNARLKPAFQDYRGSFIEPLQNGAISVTLLFNQLSTDKIDTSEDAPAVAFLPAESLRATGKNIAERNRALANEMNNGRKYHISDEAKSAFEDLIAGNPNKINWNNIAGENYQKQGWTQEGYCYIKGIDIIKVLEIIYGSKDMDTGAKSYYYPVIVNSVPGPNPARPTNWTMNIQFMSDNSVKDICDEFGYSSTGLFNCVEA